MHLDQLSFWIGVVAGSLLWFAIFNLRQLWPRTKEALVSRASRIKLRSGVDFDELLRKAAIRRAQGMHLSSSLFSLDEILVEPRLMTPLPQVSPDLPPPTEDIISQTISYMPDWPELSAQFGASTLSIDLPVSQGVSFAIVGQPGSGKTTALAYLASMVSRRESYHQVVNDLLPILVHINDLSQPLASQADLIKPIADYLTGLFPGAAYQKLPAYLVDMVNQGKVLLLLDGLDELSASNLRDVSSYIDKLLHKYPGLHLVTTAAPEYWDGIISSNIRTFSIAAWGRYQVLTFLNTWATNWKQSIAPILPPSRNGVIDPLIVQSWLAVNYHCLNPLEWTVIIWAACLGDLRGPRITDAIDVTIQRLAGNHTRESLEAIALQMILSGSLRIDQAKANLFAPSSETAQKTHQTLLTATSEAESQISLREALGVDQNQPDAGNEFLFVTAGPSLSFIHPVFAGYLAGCALAADNNAIRNVIGQQTWIGRSLAVRYTSSKKDLSDVLNPFIQESEEPLYRGLFQLARWMKDTPAQTPWRSTLIDILTKLLQREMLPMPIRHRALAALVYSEDISLAGVFREMLGANSPKTIQLAILGCSGLGDRGSVEAIIRLLQKGPLNVRNAACLALVGIGTQSAIEEVARALLQSDEPTRRAAAEALSAEPIQGFPILKEGSSVGDLLVRRAVVYGLARISDKWALEILEKIRVDDSQWIVRNAAAQAIEARQAPNPNIPRQWVHASQAPWVIAFAARQGVGVAGGVFPVEMLLKALKAGDEDERMAALEYLRGMQDQDILAAIFNALYEGVGTVKEAAANALYELAASGVTLPSTESLVSTQISVG